MPIHDPPPYPLLKWYDPESTSKVLTVTCDRHGTAMRWAAKHGSTKPRWYCDECHKEIGNPLI